MCEQSSQITYIETSTEIERRIINIFWKSCEENLHTIEMKLDSIMRKFAIKTEI